jgi:hypothetical protein
MAVLTPISRPDESSSGPPLLPGLMAASVWMHPWIGRPPAPLTSRPTAETTPVAASGGRQRGHHDVSGGERRTVAAARGAARGKPERQASLRGRFSARMRCALSV